MLGFSSARTDAPDGPNDLASAFRAAVNSASGSWYSRSISSSGEEDLGVVKKF